MRLIKLSILIFNRQVKQNLWAFPALAILLLLGTGCQRIQSNKVTDIDQFNSRVISLQPGDTLILANGVWRDVQLVFEGKGTKDHPIVLMAEEPGKVTIEGESNLNLSGEYLEVSGLVFINGHTSKETVIAFRKDSEHLANHSRVTNCAIDHFNQTNRFKTDTWVELHGKNNRLDHCYFGGKLNAGETVRVKLNNPGSQQNDHRIDHNYFGYRPRLGSNTGETLRVGTSTYSLIPSNTLIENNYFEECSGEVECVSIKASDNIVRGNTFIECEGVLALRHGDRNVVEENFFIGNAKPHTGGVRVVNTGQIIRNNHFQELKGERFFGTLPIMNGVPNSLINRYHHANDIAVENNHFFNCDYIEFGVGSDNERTEAPENIIFTNNIFYNPNQKHVYIKLDDISTFCFGGNKATTASSAFSHKGFSPNKTRYNKKGSSGLFQGGDYSPQLIATAVNCGPQWYNKLPKYYDIKQIGKSVLVNAASGSLNKAIDESTPGDTLKLTEAEYLLEDKIILKHSLTIVGEKDILPVIRFKENESEQSFIELSDGASLVLKNVLFNGHSPNGIASSAVTTSTEATISHYNFKAYNCGFVNFNASRFTAFQAYKNTFADTIIFEGCLFQEISGDAINLAGELDEKGRYNAENVVLKNCRFVNVMGAGLNLLRGGNDESTLGPFLEVDHCSFINVNNKELGSVLLLTGVQRNEIKNCMFQNSGRSGRAIKLEDPAWAKSIVHHSRLYNSGRIESYYDRVGQDVKISAKSLIIPGILGDDRKEIGCHDLSNELEKVTL